MTRPAWQALAACRDVDTSIFFPDVDAGHSFDYGPAKAVCAGCVVRTTCLEAGLRERHGLWGGHTVAERQRLVRVGAKRRRAAREEFAVVEAMPCGGCGECEAS